MNIYYEAIVGSRCYGLELPDSDTDLARVSDDWNPVKHESGFHLLQRPREEFVAGITFQKPNLHYVQWLFPASVRTPGVLASYLLEHRESILSSSLPIIWKLFWENACGLAEHAEHYYEAFPKRLAYSTLRFATLARYAEGMCFSEAFRPEESLRQKLLSVRQGNLPVKEAILLNNSIRQEAEKAAGFYDRPQDLAYIVAVTEDLRDILRLS